MIFGTCLSRLRACLLPLGGPPKAGGLCCGASACPPTGPAQAGMQGPALNSAHRAMLGASCRPRSCTLNGREAAAPSLPLAQHRVYGLNFAGSGPKDKAPPAAVFLRVASLKHAVPPSTLLRTHADSWRVGTRACWVPSGPHGPTSGPGWVAVTSAVLWQAASPPPRTGNTSNASPPGPQTSSRRFPGTPAAPHEQPAGSLMLQTAMSSSRPSHTTPISWRMAPNRSFEAGGSLGGAGSGGLTRLMTAWTREPLVSGHGNLTVRWYTSLASEELGMYGSAGWGPCRCTQECLMLVLFLRSSAGRSRLAGPSGPALHTSIVKAG